MNEIGAAFCGIILVVFSFVGAALALIRRPRASRPVLRPAGVQPRPVGRSPQHVRITFLRDNPWFNAGETMSGLLTRSDDHSLTFQSDLEPETPYNLPDDPSRLQIEDLPSL